MNFRAKIFWVVPEVTDVFVFPSSVVTEFCDGFSFCSDWNVDSTDSNCIGTDCKSSWKGTPTPPSDDACSENKVQGAAFRGCGRKHRETPSSAQEYHVGYYIETFFKVNTVVEFHVNEHVIIP